MTGSRRPDLYRFDQRRFDQRRLDHPSRTHVLPAHGPQPHGRQTRGPKTRARPTHDRRSHEHSARARPIALRPPAADPAMAGRCSTGERDGRPESLAPWVAVQTWFRAWSVQTSSEPGPVAAAEVLLQAALQAAAHRRPGYQRAASRQVGFAPVPGVSWPAEAVRMKAAWQRAGSVRRAAGHPSEGDFVPLQSTIRPARPLSTQSRTAAVVVSPIHPQCATQAPAFTGKSRAVLSPFSDKLGSLLVKWPRIPVAGVPEAGIPGRADCLSASPELCPKTVSDNLLHDLCCDCLPGTGQAGFAGRLRAPCVLARAT